MFRNILVGVDGSAGADRALRHAVDLAEANRGRLGLLCVAPQVGIWASIAPFGLPISRAQMDSDLVTEARRDVDRAEQAVPDDVPVTKMLVRGRPVEAFATHAQRGCWDLIVIGQRRWSLCWPGGWRFAARLIRSSPVPVLVVADEPAPSRASSRRPAVRSVQAKGSTTARRSPSPAAPQS